ncbi:methyltransferase domain-containing protein [Nocardia thailandica]
MIEPSGGGTLTEYIISARSLAEYRAIFELGERDLAGRRVLDCPGGASSFTAEASAAGARVTAADPIYALPPAELAARALPETDRGNSWAYAHAGRYRWDWYGSRARHARIRRTAAGRFAADVTGNPHRYVAAALPALPFPDNDFDLVLSSHLLFSYADRLDADFHLAALTELARVSAREVRVYPLLDYTGAALDELVDGLRARLRDTGIRSSLRRTGYEFHHGAHTMLILHTASWDTACRHAGSS